VIKTRIVQVLVEFEWLSPRYAVATDWVRAIYDDPPLHLFAQRVYFPHHLGKIAVLAEDQRSVKFVMSSQSLHIQPQTQVDPLFPGNRRIGHDTAVRQDCWTLAILQRSCFYPDSRCFHRSYFGAPKLVPLRVALIRRYACIEVNLIHLAILRQARDPNSQLKRVEIGVRVPERALDGVEEVLTVNESMDSAGTGPTHASHALKW